MTKRYGIYRINNDKEFSALFFRLGITDIFSVMSQYDFISDQQVKKQAQFLYHHFSHVKNRLAHSLDLLQRSVLSIEEEFNKVDENFLIGINNIIMNAEVAALSVIAHLNIFVDDVARIVHLILTSTTFDNLQFPFTDVKRKAGTDAQYRTFKTIFDELDQAGSWWQMAFKYGVGMRQRLIHYPDIIQFEGEKIRPEEPYRAYCAIFDPLMGRQPIN